MHTRIWSGEDEGACREMTAALDGIAVISALAIYRREVVPRVRDELQGWEARAGVIPDPALREAALSALREKRPNAEATAVFAILAPRPRRAGALRAMTALQTTTDYLDTLGERPLEDPLASGLALHRALGEAMSPSALPSDWYDHYPHSEDGGYMAALVATCRQEFAALPASEAVRPVAWRAAVRCGEGQSYTHAAAGGKDGRLEAWAARQPGPQGYSWWEVAAGASSSVAVHALIAAAAEPSTSAAEAELIDAAYFPPIGALTVLLDDLVDLEEDRATDQHNYMSCYPSSEVAAERLASVAERATAATGALRHRSRHAAILAGVAGYYLSAPAAGGEFAAPIRKAMLDTLGPTVRLVMATMRSRRRG